MLSHRAGLSATAGLSCYISSSVVILSHLAHGCCYKLYLYYSRNYSMIQYYCSVSITRVSALLLILLVFISMAV